MIKFSLRSSRRFGGGTFMLDHRNEAPIQNAIEGSVLREIERILDKRRRFHRPGSPTLRPTANM